MIFLDQSGRYSLISDCCWHGRFGSYYLWCMMFGSSNVDIMSDIVSLDAWCSCGLVMYDCYMACELIILYDPKSFSRKFKRTSIIEGFQDVFWPVIITNSFFLQVSANSHIFCMSILLNIFCYFVHINMK